MTNRPKNTAMKYLTNVPINTAMLCVLVMLGRSVRAQSTSLPNQNPVTAVDILLEPDATMLQHAEANNARLLKVFPKGFGLDAAHRPHITMLQCFVRTEDLDKVYAAAGQVLGTAKVQATRVYPASSPFSLFRV
jgi:hypothetical protein